MVTFDSRGSCALTLSLIALADVSIIFNIPVLRQVLGFIMLTFVPGFLLIQIAQLKMNPLEKVLFLIGLSVSFLMFVPLAMNFVYPILGISRPISLFPLVTTFSLLLAGLSLFVYKKGAQYLQITALGVDELIDRVKNPLALGAALVLVLGILGGLLLRFDLDSLLSLLSMLSIAVAVVIIVASRRVSARFYPLYIFAIALALLYSRTLASANLFGYDIFGELYVADLVKASGVWNPSLVLGTFGVGDYYTMLTVAILPNVYSMLLNVDTVWVFKLIIPFIAAFVPVGLYQLWKTQLKFSDKCAFLSSFFFISFYVFYDQMIIREEVAGLFLVLALLLLLSSRVRGVNGTALLIVVIASLAVSHYASSYVFMFYLVILLIGSILAGVKNAQAQRASAISGTLVALAIAIVLSWYLLTGGGAPYVALVETGTHVVSSLSNELFAVNSEPVVAGVFGSGVSYVSFLHVLAHYWVIATLVLIAVGLIAMVWRRKAMRANVQFLVLSLASFVMMLFAVGAPAFAAAINGDRLYALASFFLAPCCVLGILAIVDTPFSWIRVNKDIILKLKYAAVIAVLIPNFLFMTGTIFEITEHPSNYALLPSQNQSGRTIEYSFQGGRDWSYLVQTPVPDESVYAARWLSSSMSPLPVYADHSGAQPQLVGDGHISPGSVFLLTSPPSPKNGSYARSYVYLGAANVQNGSIVLTLPNNALDYQQFSSLPELTAGCRVYSNGLAEVYYYP
jgi:uncharacterized membrane protein